MSALGYVGKNTPSNGRQVSNRLAVDTSLSSGITRSVVDQKVENAVANLARTDYVDAQDANLTTPEYALSQDGLLLPKTQLGATSGVATLDSSSRLLSSYFPGGMGKGKFRGPYALTNRNAGYCTPANNGQNADNYVKVGQWSLAAPGFTWRPVIFMSAFAQSWLGSGAYSGQAGGRADIECRVGGSYNSTLCASGRGHNSVLGYQGITVMPNTDLTPQTGASYTGYGATTPVNIGVFLYQYFGGNTAELAGSGNYITNGTLYLLEMGTTS